VDSPTPTQWWKVPAKPDMAKYGVQSVSGRIEMVSDPSGNTLDLFIFGPLSGKCYKCGSAEIKAARRCSHLKFVYRIPRPMYALGIDIICVSCGTTVKSIDGNYVKTLPPIDARRMTFFQVGKSYGIDMDMMTNLRMGDSGTSIAAAYRVNLDAHWWRAKCMYDDLVSKEMRLCGAAASGVAPYYSIPEEWYVSSYTLIAGLIREFLLYKDELLREIQSCVSEQAFAVDHQAKVVKRVRQSDGDVRATQSFTICGDKGLILNYCVVPSTGIEYQHDALDEVCARHGSKCPSVLFVDCGCCNGRPHTSPSLVKTTGSTSTDVATTGSAGAGITTAPRMKSTDTATATSASTGTTTTASTTTASTGTASSFSRSNSSNSTAGNRLWMDKLVRRLDGLHVCMRITREVNAEHPRYREFTQQISKCIYTRDASDLKLLEDTIQKHGLKLSVIEKNRDIKTYVRRVPTPGGIAAAKLMCVMKAHEAIDKEAMERAVACGMVQKGEPLSSADLAHPLITKKVKTVIQNQMIHCANGCIAAGDNLFHIAERRVNYRNTGSCLPVYSSPFGASRCETVHSSQARSFYNFHQVRCDYFDARSVWRVIHFNRRKLFDHPDNAQIGVLPRYAGVKLAPPEPPPMPFGYGCFRHVVQRDNEALYSSLCGDDDSLDIEKEVEKEFCFGDDDDSSIEDDELGVDVNGPMTPKQVAESSQQQGRADNPPAPALVDKVMAAAGDLVSAQGTGSPELLHGLRTPSGAGHRKASLKRDVRRKRDLAAQADLVPPDFNDDMLEVWEQIYRDQVLVKGRNTKIDSTLASDCIKQYVPLMMAEREKEERRPLLRVGIEHVKNWLKKRDKEASEPWNNGTFSGEASALAGGVARTLANDSGVKANSAERPDFVFAAGAPATHALAVPTAPAKKPRIHKCSICGKPLGARADGHPKGECPDETEEMRLGREAAKALVKQKKATRDWEKLLRRDKARKFYRDNKIPNLVDADLKADPGKWRCDVCGMTLQKGAAFEQTRHIKHGGHVAYCYRAGDELLIIQESVGESGLWVCHQKGHRGCHSRKPKGSKWWQAS